MILVWAILATLLAAWQTYRAVRNLDSAVKALSLARKWRAVADGYKTMRHSHDVGLSGVLAAKTEDPGDLLSGN